VLRDATVCARLPEMFIRWSLALAWTQLIILSNALLPQISIAVTSFVRDSGNGIVQRIRRPCNSEETPTSSSRTSLLLTAGKSEDDGGMISSSTSAVDNNNTKNRLYVEGLLENLTTQLDQWICTGNPAARQRANNVLEEIGRLSQDPKLIQRANRLAQRAGLPPPSTTTVTSNADTTSTYTSRKRRNEQDEATLRREQAVQRRQWEASREQAEESVNTSGSRLYSNDVRSALGERADSKKQVLDLEAVVNQKTQLEMEIRSVESSRIEEIPDPTDKETTTSPSNNRDNVAAAKVAELVTRAGGGSAFDPATLGIGGLDDVLAQVKRRVWTPLAAPPQLLRELGINPVRGMLLYGKPGCGKTLLARTLGRILSPLR
jgi:hypothetical protein